MNKITRRKTIQTATAADPIFALIRAWRAALRKWEACEETKKQEKEALWDEYKRADCLVYRTRPKTSAGARAKVEAIIKIDGGLDGYSNKDMASILRRLIPAA